MAVDYELWKRISRRVLGAFIYSEEEFFRCYVDYGLTRIDFHPNYQAAFTTIEELRITKGPVSEEIISSKLSIDVKEISSWTQAFAWGDELSSLVDELQNGFSRRIEMQEILADATHLLENRKPVHEVASDAADRLMMVGSGAARMATSTSAIRAEIASRDKEQPYVEAIKTGIMPIDSMLNGGLRPDRVYVIAGEQKSRKTTVLLNVFLYSALNMETWQPRDISCGLLCYENNRITQYYKLLAMLIVMRMQWLNIQHIQYVNHPRAILPDINSDWLETQIRKRYFMSNQKPPEWIKCVEDCIEILDQAPIYLYDRQRQGGGLSGVSSIRKTLALHRLINTRPGQLSIGAVDFIGLARDIGMDDHTAVDMAVEIALECASAFSMGVFLLSQVSRAGKGQNVSDKYVLSSKGSARPEELAHNYWVTEYDQARNPGALLVHQKLARTGNAANIQAEFAIHPPSGAFLLANAQRSRI